jgi:hypothetical protein
MKMILESEEVLVETGSKDFPLGRMWRGHTEGGIKMCALVLFVAALSEDDTAELQRELIAIPPAPPGSREFNAVEAVLGSPPLRAGEVDRA